MGRKPREGADSMTAADQRSQPKAALHMVGDQVNTPQGNLGPGGQSETVYFPTV